MQSEKTIWFRQLAILLLLLILAPAGWAGSKYKVLYNFKGGNDGIDPHGNLVFDAAGNLYGTTAQGGGTSACHGQYEGCGIVFQLVPQSSGQWKENVLYSFTSGSTGGIGLEGNLVLDAAGNVYGTAYWGGSDFQGTVFELTPGSSGWTEKDIYAFCPSRGCGDGGSPASGVIFDNAGNLYGTATAGGADGGGVIFKLVPSNGSWTESALYSFCPYNFCHGGWYPWGLTRTANGDLYSTTTYGGNFFWPCVPGDGCGAVFKFNPKSGDYVALHQFDGRDGAFPNSVVVSGPAGQRLRHDHQRRRFWMRHGLPAISQVRRRLDVQRALQPPPRRERGIDGHRFGRKSVRRQCGIDGWKLPGRGGRRDIQAIAKRA